MNTKTCPQCNKLVPYHYNFTTHLGTFCDITCYEEYDQAIQIGESDMAKVYFTSDWHFGHRNILKYRPEFKSIEEHNQTFINEFNSKVRKRDTVYFLGDIAFTEESLELLKQLNYCHKKVLYLGNHDYLHTSKYLEIFDEVYALRSLKSFWLSHCPIHPQEMRNRKGNIHGHLHESILDDSKYFDVSPEKHNYQLVDFETIKTYFKEQEDVI